MKWLNPTCVLVTTLLMAAASLEAEEKKPPVVEWSAKDIAGAAVKVPAEKTSLMLFMLPDQPQSQQAMEIVKAAAQKAGNVQIIAIVSGKEAEGSARKLAGEGKLAAAFVADPDYAASGKRDVHVWPTTLVVRPDGLQVAHLAGLPKYLAKDLDAYLAFAAGKMDAAGVKREVDAQANIVDSPQQMARRHLSVAQRLLDKGMADQAKVELSQGLKLQPENVQLQLAMAEVLVSGNDGAGAMQYLESLDKKGISTARIKILRGRALIALGKWDEAQTALEQAAKLNPDPSVAYYELGRVYQHQGRWEQAAGAYRRAFETTTAGRKVAEARPKGAPATRP